MKLFKQFYLPLIVVFVSAGICATPLNELLEFDRANIHAGQWWLLLTGHLSHLDWPHWFLNNAALLIIWELFYRNYNAFKACVEFVILAMAIGSGIYLFNPDVQWYVGLSGILHGMFAIGVMGEIFQKRRLSYLVGCVFAAKIIWEQTIGITTGFLFDPEEILVDAHLYGAITGVVVAIIYKLPQLVNKTNLQKRRAS